jgi:ATP-dependent DNA helicase RecQ
MGTEARAHELLHDFLGPAATFRPGQLEAVEALVDDRRRTLVVQRTGWGKSIVYLIATRLVREAGGGPTVVISPLLALMRNQIEMGERIGVRSATINSENPDDWTAIEDDIREARVDLLLISPERLNNARFRENLLGPLARSVGLFVVDEVHCISDWGHDFRPDYRRIGRILDRFPRTVPVLGCTATANDRVIADVVTQFGDDLLVIRGPLSRESLRLRVLDLPSQAERLAWLARELPRMEGTGIVYCLTIEDTNRAARWLRAQGHDAVAYTGQTTAEDRLIIEDRLSRNEVKAVVATSALGMGYDKPDLAFVIHFQSPGSPVAYYQQIGRAGRGLDTAEVVLLRGHEDRDIQDWFIKTAFPDKADAEAVLAYLGEQEEPVGIGAIERIVNVRRSRLEAMLKILEVEGAVGRDGGKWYRTAVPWAYDSERIERVTAHRRQEQAAMEAYGTNGVCLMGHLLEQLDDPTVGRCGRCSTCLPTETEPVDPARVAEAVMFLRRQPVIIGPRRQWPTGFEEFRGRIGPDEQLEEGRALCLWGDAGWGRLVREGKYQHEHFDDELVTAAAQLVQSWAPDPAPTWVTAVPSTKRPDLVRGFASRLGAALGLPFLEVVTKVRDARPQKEMDNSAQQAANVYGAFAVIGEVPEGPALLVDDVVDSGWTLTVTGVALRQAGAAAVHPLVLAKATGD